MSKPAHSVFAERCPVCRKPASDAHRPFCSQGCRDRDLIAWLDDRYVLPGRPTEEDGNWTGRPTEEDGNWTGPPTEEDGEAH